MGKLATEGLFNTRDLGGMKTADGRIIKSGLLFRSGLLYPATENDLKLLYSLGLAAVIDFRATEEIRKSPDPVLQGAKYYYFPVDSEENNNTGLRRDEEAEKLLIDLIIDKVVEDPGFSVHYMCETYRKLVTSSHSSDYYARFVRILLESEGPVLWHCTAGKDRAGFASVIVEKLLGVADEDIMSDYLYTNECLVEDTERIISMLREKITDETVEKAVRELFAADERYLQALLESMNEKYGSWDAFFEKALHMDDKKREEFIYKYTELT